MKQEKQNPFIKYNGIKDAKVHIHKTSGLYDASNEHDACGVGMICLLYTSDAADE